MNELNAEQIMIDEKIVSQEIDIRDIMDVSIITEALKTWKAVQ